MNDYDTLIIYQIENSNDLVNTFVKNNMALKGYFNGFVYENAQGAMRAVDLPNYALWRPATDIKTAISDICCCLRAYEKETINRYEIAKSIAVRFTIDWMAGSREATRNDMEKYPKKITVVILREDDV